MGSKGNSGLYRRNTFSAFARLAAVVLAGFNLKLITWKKFNGPLINIGVILLSKGDSMIKSFTTPTTCQIVGLPSCVTVVPRGFFSRMAATADSLSSMAVLSVAYWLISMSRPDKMVTPIVFAK